MEMSAGKVHGDAADRAGISNAVRWQRRCLAIKSIFTVAGLITFFRTTKRKSRKAKAVPGKNSCAIGYIAHTCWSMDKRCRNRSGIFTPFLTFLEKDTADAKFVTP